MVFIKRLVRAALKTIGTSLEIAAILAGAYGTTIPPAYLINKCITPERKTIVFTSGENDFKNYHLPKIPTPVIAGVIDFGMYTPITLRHALINGNQVEWCSNPDLETFVEKLENPEFENIVLIGHGRKDCYALKDFDVEPWFLRSLRLPKRNGEFYQYTCGIEGKKGESLKDALFDKCTRSKTFEDILDPFTSYVYAWTDWDVHEEM